MTRLTWDEKDYQSGLDRGIFCPIDGIGVVWDGLVSVTESPASSISSRYQDGRRVGQHQRANRFEGTINAYSCPSIFYDTVLIPRRAKPFHMSYRVKTAKGYKIHLVYNVLVSLSDKSFSYNEITPLQWNFTTRPMPIPSARPGAHLIVETSKAYSWVVEEFESILYGTDDIDSVIPSPADVFSIFEQNALLTVTNNGDGSFTVEGPDYAITMVDPTRFEIEWPSAVYVDDETYTIHSL